MSMECTIGWLIGRERDEGMCIQAEGKEQEKNTRSMLSRPNRVDQDYQKRKRGQ